MLQGTADLASTLKLGVFGAIAIIARMICQTQSLTQGQKAASAAKRAIRGKVYDKLVALGPAYNETIPTATAVQICVEGTEQLESYFGSYLPQLFYALAAPLTLFACLAPVSLSAAGVLLACVPLIPLSIVAVQRFAKKTMRRYWGSYTDLGSLFLESLQGLTTLKIYQADEARQRVMDEEAETFRTATMNLLKMQLNSITVMDLFAFGGAALGIIVMLVQFAQGSVTFAGAFTFVFLSAEFFIPLRTLGSFFHTAMNGMAAAEKMYAVLDEPLDRKGTRAISANDASIETHGLGYVYADGREALRDIDFKAEAGSFIGIAGESGSGKSTLAGALAGRNARYTGSVLVGGVEARDIETASLRSTITYLSHESYLFKGTVRENLLLARPDADDTALWDALSRARIDDFIRAAGGLDARILPAGSNFSGGQRQRIAMARALLRDTPVYIFDEATSNIDAESENAIVALIGEIAREHTVIMISHRLRTLTSADMIYVLEDGGIACSGTHDRLIEEDNPYARMWAKQAALEMRIDHATREKAAGAAIEETEARASADAAEDVPRARGTDGSGDRISGPRVMRRLATLVRPLAPAMIAAVALGVIGFLAAGFLTIFAVLALLSFANGSSILPSAVACALVAACGVLRGPARYGEQMCNHYLAFRILALVRTRVFEALRKLAPAKLDGRDKGDLVSTITSDVELLEVFYAHTLSPVAIAILTSLIMTAFIAWFSPALAVLALAGYLVVGAGIPALAAHTIGDAGRTMRDAIGNMNSFVLESLEGLAETLQFGAEKTRAKAMGKAMDELAEVEAAMKRRGAVFMALTGAIIMAFDLAALALGAHLLHDGLITFEAAAVSIAALMSSFGPVVATANLGSTLQQTVASGARVFSLLDETPAVEEVVDGKGLDSFARADARNASFSYGGDRVLDNVCFSAQKGEIIGVEGRSGAGKSTLLKLFMRFYDPDAGVIEISGDDLRTINTHDLRRLEGFMTQETHLFTGTIRDNLLIARPDASDEEIAAAVEKAALSDFVENLPAGIDTPVGEFGESLSGGERQRIGLARVFLHDAPLVLLDEPTSNLDALSEAAVLEAIAANRENKTVILVSHRPTASAICDRTCRLDGLRAS